MANYTVNAYNNGGTGKSSIVNASASYNQDITHKSL